MQHQVRWTAEKLSQRLTLIEPLVHSRKIPLPPFRYKKLDSPNAEPPVAPGVRDKNWEIIAPPCAWSDWQTDFVLRTTFQIPDDIPADAEIALHLHLGEFGVLRHPETLLYIDGVQHSGVDRHHHEIRLSPELRDGKSHHLALHGWTSFMPGTTNRPYMRACHLVVIDQPTRDFIVLARVALGTANALADDIPARSILLDTLDAAFHCLDLREPLGSEEFYASVPGAYALLRRGISRAGAPLDIEVRAAGHAHIDVAWLWTLDQSKQKARRTFHTVLRYMDQYPFYTFTQSQPQLYDYVRQIDPPLFEGIRQRVAEGRWEATGGMWVEADCNLTGPESLARQFLLGRSFYREHFGVDADTPVLWLPDVFGYAWNLPQLIREAGMEYFFTIKIGWNQYNRLPYDTFWWQGLDGTRVLTHFSTTPESDSSKASTYNAEMTPSKILGTWQNFQQKELYDTPLLISYGHGDGGGGPERAMLENMAEMSSFPALPRVKPGKVSDFFHAVEETSSSRLPVWNGELYLEYHRGTYTTQARSKRANRKSEFLLHDAEFLAALAAGIDPAYSYPHTDLRRAWELVCLNQFHDILPGTSIQEVYLESMKQYDQVAKLASDVRFGALQSLAAHAGGDMLVINPSGLPRHDLAFTPSRLPADQRWVDAQGRPVPAQTRENGTWLDLGPIEPFSTRVLQVRKIPRGTAMEQPPALVAQPDLLENEVLRVELNESGDITRIYDKANRREVLAPGKTANLFQAFEDRPLHWDAWDVDIFYDDKQWAAGMADAVRVVDAGPLRAAIEVRRKILGSTITQVISLSTGSARLDFDTHVDWKERHVLLKVAFPVDLLSPKATYEIQWGNVERPTHRNTSWDWARFETVAQKWVDLSEGDYGVSLLNDCKYGHDIQGNVLRLSLLRSPTHPDPEADQGEHHFTYSLLPHVGGWDERTIAEAYALNDPLIVFSPAKPAPVVGDLPSMFSLDQSELVIETVKQAEDGRGWIVRLYESRRTRGQARLTAAFPIQRVFRSNLLEEDQSELTGIEGNAVTVSYHPFQIITLRVIPE